MFYNLEKTMIACTDDPSLIFDLIKEGHFGVVDKLLSRKKVDINTCDSDGNNVLMALLKEKEFKLVLKYIKRTELDINHQNHKGDTISHIVATIHYKYVMDIVKQIKKNKELLPNIKNNNNETALDKATENNSMYTSFKILEDKRFTNIDVISFKNLYEKFVKNKHYGKYTRFNNLEVIIDRLETKPLRPKLKRVIKYFEDNKSITKESILKNKSKSLDKAINNLL